MPSEVLTSLSGIDEPGRLADTIAAHLSVDLAEKQNILEMSSVKSRLEHLMSLMDSEIDLFQVEKKIRGRVKKQMEKSQREYYLNEQMQTANWLVKALHQRAQTIMKVASTIVERQELFFTKGVQHLKPLILRDISEAVDIHESTVSRATTNKYISTPRGMFELKYFFTASISAAGDGEAHSAEAVRHRIKALVDAEQANAILSDDTIVDLLKDDGVDIARRTVAKYREALRIPSSVKRRRLKAMA